MFYSIDLRNNAYFCTVRKKRDRLGLFINQLSKRGKHKNNKIMVMRENEKNLRALAMLRYQAARYQATGRGVMCQRVNEKIRRLMKELSVNAEKN